MSGIQLAIIGAGSGLVGAALATTVRVFFGRLRELEALAGKQGAQIGEFARLAGRQREELEAAHGVLDRLGAPSGPLATRVSALWIGRAP